MPKTAKRVQPATEPRPPFFFWTMPKLKQAKRGRPQAVTYTAEQVAELLEIPASLVRARARLSFFPGAKCLGDNEWEIPRDSVELALQCKVEPHWSITKWSGLLGLEYHDLYKATQEVNDLSDPLLPGKYVRAIILHIAGSTRKRIPQSEILRWLGYRRGSR